MHFLYPWLLLLLPLSVLPWLWPGQAAVSVPSLGMLPRDRLSEQVSVLLKLAMSLALAGLVFALASPFRPAETETRTGQGAQIILLLDRSSSMDQPFYNKDYTHIPGLAQPLARMESKGSVARRVLSDFVSARKNDRFGMLVFSTRPIEVLPLTTER